MPKGRHTVNCVDISKSCLSSILTIKLEIILSNMYFENPPWTQMIILQKSGESLKYASGNGYRLLGIWKKPQGVCTGTDVNFLNYGFSCFEWFLEEGTVRNMKNVYLFFFFLKCEILFIVCLYSMRSNPIQSNPISLFDFIYFFFVVSFFVRKMERINKNNQAKKKRKKIEHSPIWYQLYTQPQT